MSRDRTTIETDRAVSSSVTHILALGITTILISGLFISANALFNDQQDAAAREQLSTIGNRLADELTRASILARRDGNVTITTRHQATVADEAYGVELLTGSDCQNNLVSSETCLDLQLYNTGTRVMIPVRNETPVDFVVESGGTYTISATRNGTPTKPAVDIDFRIGIGDDVGSYVAGDIVNLTNQKPVAGFEFSPGQPTVDTVIHFQEDSDDLDGSIVSYEWDLNGDGNVDVTGAEFNHSYAEPGRYTATLTVTDDDGATASVSKVIVVAGLVYNEDVTAIDTGTVTDGGVSFTVTNHHDDTVTIEDILWDPANDSIDYLRSEPDDGVDEIYFNTDSGGTGGGHDVSSSGEIEIFDEGRIFELDDDGNVNGGTVEILGDTDDPDNDASVYFRGFGPATNSDPKTDMYNEEVFVGIRYQVSGKSYTSQFTLYGDTSSNDPPNPDFTVTCTDRDCDFDATGSSDPDGSIVSYDWNFDDGDTATGTTPSHTFPANESYDVSLTVVDDDGVSAILTKTVDLSPAPPVVVAINAGGEEYTADGITYEEDTEDNPHQYHTGENRDDTTSDPIANTTHDTLYQSQRENDEEDTFGYDIPLPDGEYSVTFKFAEIGWDSDDFDVELEGSNAISNLNIENEVGQDYALWKTRTVTVTDGELNVWFDPDDEEDDVRLAALVVEELDVYAFQESGGEVVMEAENYMTKRAGNGDDANGDDMSGDSWNEDYDGDASGNDELDAGNSNGDNAQDTTNGERLDYYVNFTNTGTYYVWVRMECDSGSEDSIHAGLDESPQSYGGTGLTESASQSCNDASGFMWASHAAGSHVTVDVTSTGRHNFNIWMREDGTEIDKIVLTTDSGYTPSGEGPAESTVS